MKTLFLSLICTFTCLSLFAQVDSTNNTNNTNPTTVTPQTTTPPANNNATDTAANMNSTNSNMNSTNSNMNSNNSNSNANMNSNNMNSNMNSMNRMDSSSMVNTSNTPGQANYAALPVLETYVPDNIVSAVKQEHEGSYIYDITAVKAPMDSSSMSQANSMNQNSTAMNSTTTTTNSTTTTTTQDTTTTSNATVNANSNMTMGQNPNNMSNTSAPQQYQYVVRYLQGGTMTTEILNNSGTKVNNP